MFDASVYLAPLTPLAHFDLVTPQGKDKTSWLPARRVPRLLPSSSGPSATANVQTAFSYGEYFLKTYNVRSRAETDLKITKDYTMVV